MHIHYIYAGQVALAHCFAVRELGSGTPPQNKPKRLARRRFRGTLLSIAKTIGGPRDTPYA